MKQNLNWLQIYRLKGLKTSRLFVLIIVAVLLSSCTKEASLVKREAFLMNTVLTVSIDGDEEVLDKVFERLEEIDRLYNRKNESSEIYLINNHKLIRPSKEVYDLLDRSFQYAKVTDGAFNPAIGPLVDLWGIDGTGRELSSIPSADEIKKTIPLCDYNNVSIKDREVNLPEEMSIDLGAIVKGYATDEIVKILRDDGIKSAIIDLGGNIFAYGEKAGGNNWRIGVADPFIENRESLLVLEGKDFSLVTSGNYERYIIYKGKKYHHILDTGTGMPAENELASVSIISAKSELCDMLSTTLFVNGIEKGVETIKNFDAGVIFVTKDKRILASSNIYNMINLDSIKEGFILEKIDD